MHEKFMSILACPETGAELQLSVTERFPDGTVKTGELIAAGTQKRYPVTGGIPRFVQDASYAESFSFEWSKFGKTQLEKHNQSLPTKNATYNTFVDRTTFTSDKISGKMVVEFGCGAGRFLEVIRQLGGIAIGLELTNAVDVAGRNLPGDPDVLLVQASVYNPPFKKNSIDFGFTMGVLHHTPSPAKGLKKLVEVVKPGGGVAVCVYPEGGFYSFPSVYWMRKLVNTMKQYVGARPAYGFAMLYARMSAFLLYPVFRILEKIPKMGLNAAGMLSFFFFVIPLHPTVSWRILDTFDAITPHFASTHNPEDLEFWLEEFGCTGITNTAGILRYSQVKSTAYVAVKKS